MERLKQWWTEQREEKHFRVLVALLAVLLIVLCAEFVFFEYLWLKIFRYLFLVCGLALIAWIDHKKQIIPNEILIVLLIVRTLILTGECLYAGRYWMSVIIAAVMGFMIGGGIFLVCYLLTRGAIGAGDVKLFAVLGYFVGSGMIFGTVFLIVLLSAFYSIGMLIMRKTTLKKEIPFAPFVFFGTVLAMALGL